MPGELPVTFYDPTFDLSPIPYVEGYNDPEANVVFVCSDKKAMRVHDYYLKAESSFFRDMFKAGTKGGPIGLSESSGYLVYILDNVTRAPFSPDRAKPSLYKLIKLDKIAQKYMLDVTGVFIRRLIARQAKDCPPLALEFALACHPQDKTIAKAVLQNFKNRMVGPTMDSYFVKYIRKRQREGNPPGYRDSYSPAASNLRWDFVEEKLGLQAFYAYSRALDQGQQGEDKWDWKVVANAFVFTLDLEEQELPLLMWRFLDKA